MLSARMPSPTDPSPKGNNGSFYPRHQRVIVRTSHRIKLPLLTNPDLFRNVSKFPIYNTVETLYKKQ